METRPILWMDGSTEDTLPGKLLSDNLEFFGETVPTGADYRYLTPLLSLTDSEQDLAELRGRRGGEHLHAAGGVERLGALHRLRRGRAGEGEAE